MNSYWFKSPVLIRAVLEQIADVGGEWSCSARSSTSYELLKLAEKRGLIKIHSTQPDGTMNGEPMYAIKFTVATPTGNTSSSKPSTLLSEEVPPQSKPENPRPVETTPRTVTETAEKNCSEKTISELKKQLASAIESLGSTTQPGADKVLTPESYGEILQSALTKVKNNPDIPSEDLVYIDALQEALNRKAPEDLARIATLRAELANSHTELPLTEPTLPGSQRVPTSPRQVTPTIIGSSVITLSVDNANKAAAQEKHHDTLKPPDQKNGKSSETKSGDTAAKAKSGIKTTAKAVGGGAGVVVGIFTVLEAGLQGYEKLTKE